MRPCHFLLAAMLAGASLALVFAPAPVWASTPVDWGIGVQSCPAATNAGYDQYMVRPGASFHCTIGAAQSSGTTQTVDVLRSKASSHQMAAWSAQPGHAGSVSLRCCGRRVSRVPTGPTPVKAPFTVSVPAKTAPGDYFGYLAIVNPSPTCPSGATTCVKIESQVASPFTLIVANPDGSAPAQTTSPSVSAGSWRSIREPPSVQPSAAPRNAAMKCLPPCKIPVWERRPFPSSRSSRAQPVWSWARTPSERSSHT